MNLPDGSCQSGMSRKGGSCLIGNDPPGRQFPNRDEPKGGGTCLCNRSRVEELPLLGIYRWKEESCGGYGVGGQQSEPVRSQVRESLLESPVKTLEIKACRLTKRELMSRFRRSLE